MSLKSGIGFRGPNQTLSALAQAVGYVADLPTFAHKMEKHQTGCRMWLFGDGADTNQITGAFWIFNQVSRVVNGVQRTGFMAMPLYVTTAAATLLSPAKGIANGVVTELELFCDQITLVATSSATTPKGPGAAAFPLAHGLGFGMSGANAFATNATILVDVPAQVELFTMGGCYAYGWELVKPSGGTYSAALYVPILEDRDAR